MRTSFFFSILLLLFVALQSATLDYGTRINDLPHLSRHDHSPRTAGSALTREAITDQEHLKEGSGYLDKWILRFKLYPVEADEILNIMALARIKPGALEFDPHYYAYGGAYLYPLGGWFFALAKLGVLRLADLSTMLADPQIMDRIIISGRAFVLGAFALSAWPLFLALRRLQPTGVALALVGVYLFAPASVMFSQIMKPHWYSLLWVNACLYLLVAAFTGSGLNTRRQFFLGALVGLAVGSATTNGLCSVLLWMALLLGVARGMVRPAALLTVPLAALAVFALTNPYMLANNAALTAEMAMQQRWFAHPETTPLTALARFAARSMVHGFGLGLVAALVWRCTAEAMRPSFTGARWLVAALVAMVVFAGVVSAAISTWYVNFRYIPYLLPTGLLFLAAGLGPNRRWAAYVIMALTLLQAVPLKLAYFDENDPRFSTRLQAAQWIEANLPAGAGLCVDPTPAPYNTPPVDFTRYEINSEACDTLVRVKRRPEPGPPGWSLEKAFAPRYSSERFPLVFSHINPWIGVYRQH